MFSTLRSTRDIRAVMAARRSAHATALSVHARPSVAAARAAVVAARGVGGAVQRNRAKRRLRAALATVGLLEGADLVVVAKAPAGRAPFALLVAELTDLQARVHARLGSAGPTGAR